MLLLDCRFAGTVGMFAMQGLMQERPLSISSIMDFAADYHGDTEIVSRTVEGPIHRYGYRDMRARAKWLAKALGR